MELKNHFFQHMEDCCSEYIAIRKNEHCKKHKVFIESLWKKYEEHADDHFLSDAGRHFQERFWEMYLGVSFLDQGYAINAGSCKGPEFYFSPKSGQSKVWVEATAPGLGTGDDAVPELIPDGNMHHFPEKEILLRIRSAIKDKHDELKKYKNASIVKEEDSYILAINGRRMGIQATPDPPDCGKLPFILKAVFPIGDSYMTWSSTPAAEIDSGYMYRGTIEKINGSEVSTNIFQDEKYSDISAIIYSGVNYCNYPDKMGGDYQVVHNPMAKQPIENGALGFSTEYWLEDGIIKCSTLE